MTQPNDHEPDQEGLLTLAERKILLFALDQAQEKIWSDGGFTAEDQEAVTSLHRLTVGTDQLLPAWEAVYEPGNVSDYLIGYANGEAAAKGAAMGWLQSESDKDPSRLKWEKQPSDDWYDHVLELIENHGDGVPTRVGITVRHRAIQVEGEQQPKTAQSGKSFASRDERGIPEPSDAEEKRARLFGFIEAGATEADFPSFAAALTEYVQAEEAQPRRGDAFASWLKGQRDATADHPEAHQAIDGMLDLYRLHADTGTPLNDHVCESRVVGDCECLEPAAVTEGAQR